DRRLSGEQLARAGDLGLLRDHLRRAPGADQDRDARRLAGAPAAQGLPARRHTRGVPRHEGAATGREEVVRMTTRVTPGATDADEEAAQGRVYNVAGRTGTRSSW